MIELWTDGSCPSPDGPGGWCAILVARDSDGRIVKQREVVGGEPVMTNQRAEMMALLEGLGAITHPTDVRVFTDSKYLMRAFTEGWLVKWAHNGWRTGKASGRRQQESLFVQEQVDPKAVRNRDLWEALIEAARPHRLIFTHVKGHAGYELNELADKLAGEQTVVQRKLSAPWGRVA